jgi:GT2 family glycosyltransferase
MKKAALICVTRNNAEKLQTTLNAIIRNTNPEHYDLIIIDNASSDSTLGIYQLPTLADNITIVRSGKNLHWVGGINLGIEMTKGYQYVGFLNDDIEVCPNWLENFFDVLDCNPNVAAVGPLTSNTRDWQGYDNVRKKWPDWGLPECGGIDRGNLPKMYDYIKSNGSGMTISDSLAFFCILIRRSVVDEVGGLDCNLDKFYSWGWWRNDNYFSKIIFSGYKLAISKRTYIIHHEFNELKPIFSQEWMQLEEPCVTICCFTYNQQEFIRDALESFLAQKTDFPVEILIHDDASTDNTPQIIKEYLVKYPNIFRAIFQKENQFQSGNKKVFSDVLCNLKSDFIALCDGDDYWIDYYKLQKQVSLLKENSTHSSNFHDTILVDRFKKPNNKLFGRKTAKIFYDLYDILENCFIHTSSFVFRKSSLKNIPSIFYELPSGDWSLFALLAQNGAIGYIRNTMSCYRINDSGIWQTKTDGEKNYSTRFIYETFAKYFKMDSKASEIIQHKLLELNI